MKMPAAARKIREQNVAAMEGARETARQVAKAAELAAETGQVTIRTAVDTRSVDYHNLADKFPQSIGACEGDELATHKVEAITERGAVLIGGFEEISREWLTILQCRLQKNLEGIQALAACSTLQHVVAVQTELVRDNVCELVENSRLITKTLVNLVGQPVENLTGSQELVGAVEGRTYP